MRLPDNHTHGVTLSGSVLLLSRACGTKFRSVATTLRLLTRAPNRQRVTILNAVGRLNSVSITLRHQIKRIIRRLRLSRLLALTSPRRTATLTTNTTSIPALIFASRSTLITRLRALLRPNSHILLGTSHSITLSHIMRGLAQWLIPTRYLQVSGTVTKLPRFMKRSATVRSTLPELGTDLTKPEGQHVKMRRRASTASWGRELQDHFYRHHRPYDLHPESKINRRYQKQDIARS